MIYHGFICYIFFLIRYVLQNISLNQQFNELLDTDIHSNKYPVLEFVNNPKEKLKYLLIKNYLK